MSVDSCGMWLGESWINWTRPRLRDLTRLPGNRLQRLSGARRGQYSIRINEQYRLCFRWTSHGPEDVEITDYH